MASFHGTVPRRSGNRAIVLRSAIVWSVAAHPAQVTAIANAHEDHSQRAFSQWMRNNKPRGIFGLARDRSRTNDKIRHKHAQAGRFQSATVQQLYTPLGPQHLFTWPRPHRSQRRPKRVSGRRRAGRGRIVRRGLEKRRVCPHLALYLAKRAVFLQAQLHPMCGIDSQARLPLRPIDGWAMICLAPSATPSMYSLHPEHPESHEQPGTRRTGKEGDN